MAGDMKATRSAKPLGRVRGPLSTREALARAGAQLFARYGFGGTTVEQIARRARANKAMINYYFGGKEGLYEQILLATLSRVSDTLRELHRESLAADVLLGRFIERFSVIAAENPFFPAMMLREVLSGGRHLSGRVLPEFTGLFAEVRSLFERGVREGTFRRCDPLLTHLTLIGSLAFFFATEPFRARLIAEGRLPVTRAPTPHEFAANLHGLMLRGLAAPGRPKRKGPRRAP